MAGAAALSVWARQAAELPARWTRVELDVVDAHPHAATAMHAAVDHRPDVIFGPYGSGPAVAALGATDELVWNHGGATDRLTRPRFGHALNVPAPASAYFAAVLEAVRASAVNANAVVILHAATGFGREVARGALEAATRIGFELQAHEFAAGQATAAARKLRDGLGGEADGKLPSAEVLLVAGAFADELAVAPVLLERPWQAAAFVGAGVDEVLAPLGAKREGLLGPCQWLAGEGTSLDEGPDTDWFVREFRAATGSQPPYPAAAAFAAGVLCGRCLRDTGTTDAQAVLTVAQRLDVHTLFGRFRLDPRTGLQTGHQVLVVQWRQGRRRVVWPPDRAELPLVPFFT